MIHEHEKELGVRERLILGIAWACDPQKPALSDTPLPTRLHLLILPKQIHQLRIKYSNIGAYGPFSFKPPQLARMWTEKVGGR